MRQCIDQDSLPGLDGLRQRPEGRRLHEIDDQRLTVVSIAIPAAPVNRACVRVSSSVQKGERQIVGIRRQRFCSKMIHFVHVLHGTRHAARSRNVRKRRSPMTFSVVSKQGEDTAYAPAFVLDRAVREGEITFLDVSMPSEEKLQIIGPGGLSRIQHPL